MEEINEFLSIQILNDFGKPQSIGEVEWIDDVLQFSSFINADDCTIDNNIQNYCVVIKISNEYFEKYNEDIELSIYKQILCCNMQAQLIDIIHCSLQGLQRKLFIESKILNFIYHWQQNGMSNYLNCNACSILKKPIEPEKIELAKQFILNHLSENLTIPIIAKAIGTNQCYLKSGFKQTYQQTIFDFVQENRLVTAQNILKQNPTSIADVAIKVGYSSASSFSQAYKNYFGINPKDQIKSKLN